MAILKDQIRRLGGIPIETVNMSNSSNGHSNGHSSTATGTIRLSGKRSRGGQ